MNGKYLLDTRIIILSFQDRIVKSKIDNASVIFIPSIALGELYYGAARSENKKVNFDRVKLISENSNILYCDSETAWHYGIIKASLRPTDTRLPENDLWIASLAMQHELELVTNNKKFIAIEGIEVVEGW
ncbi:MAG: PIN domain-containing protein [Bacteroidetes bacterium]|jgi:tRNA(fMet)-specific endonuclease VapC|nr:PIN domain-containing protein [Bacteroidota bacterium]